MPTPERINKKQKIFLAVVISTSFAISIILIIYNAKTTIITDRELQQYITDRIHDLDTLAVEEKDYASFSTLQWFVDEQVEEEETAGGILELLKAVGDKGQGLFMVDRKLAARGS